MRFCEKKYFFHKLFRRFFFKKNRKWLVVAKRREWILIEKGLAVSVRPFLMGTRLTGRHTIWRQPAHRLQPIRPYPYPRTKPL